MKQLITVFKFEILNFYKNKIFLSLTIIVALILAVVLSIPRISDMMGNDTNMSDEPTENMSKPIIAVKDNTSSDIDSVIQFFNSYAQNFNFQSTEDGIDKIEADINSNVYDSAIVIEAGQQYKYIVSNVAMNDNTTYMINEMMNEKSRLDKMNELGLSNDEAFSVLNSQVQFEIVNIGKDQTQNFFYTYVVIFALYMAIILYGQLVATSVATEKSSRAMEMLITSAKPVNLIFGKVFGAGLAGLTQLVILLGTGFAFYKLNASYWGNNEIINMIFGISLRELIYSFVFFILGFFIYAFIYGALGSLATRTEDINISTMPITLIFIAAFIIVMSSMTSGNIESILMKVCSYVPFTSPIAMFARITMSSVPMYEIIISIVVLILSTIGIGYLSAKIYQMGVLLYGKSLKITDLIKMKREGM